MFGVQVPFSLVPRPMRTVPVLFALLLATPVLAQTAGAANEQRFSTIVTYTFGASVRSTGGATADVLPVALLQRLAEQPALSHLDIGRTEFGQEEIVARFVFPGVDAYVTWRSASETQALLRSLEEITGAPVKTALNMRRVDAFGRMMGQ